MKLLQPKNNNKYSKEADKEHVYWHPDIPTGFTATGLTARGKRFIPVWYKLFASSMGGILICDQLLLTLTDHVLCKASSSGNEYANSSPESLEGPDSSRCLFYARRGIQLLKLNGTDLSPACVKAHPFKVFQATL